ncbi:Leucine-rich repeat-containing protein [Artemisia annua]|uniref:Leucine-rich repeat-containing protein n=1 Tax=Artemisia annua TaxID=35608 RepID=A0A2U1KQ17_ARTAN|nr:Leucine-rich repeat-containing protein [Artemisia annua]
MANLPRMIRTLNISASYLEYGDGVEDLIVNWKKSSRRLGKSRFFVLLDLSGNNISGEIPASLGNLKALKQLNISHNRISGHIPLSLGNLESIESLDVSHNEISGSIPQSLVQLHELGTLDVSNNMLTGKIPSGWQMDTMNELGFQNNSGLCGIPINIKCSEDIPSSEGRVKEEEDLSRMFWEGTWIGVDLRSAKVCELGLLNYKAKHVFYPSEKKKFRCHYDYYWASVFEVEYTDHSGHPHIAFAEAPNEALLPDCRPTFNGAWLAKDKFKRVTCSRTGSVTELDLNNVATPPGDSDPVSISSEILTPIFHIRSLELLDISYNYFEGEIPGDGFGNLTKLLYLGMWMNKFNGSIPNQLFQLTNLRYLDMSLNHLEGKLGPELGSFRKLTTLRVSNNRFQGPIPAQLFELESLQYLDLSGNKLEGVLSPEVGNLTKLRYFSLLNNSFSGGIPSSIANLTKLETLDLSRNSLSLEIPTFIGRLTNLASLLLSSNQLTGPIPPSMQNLSKLENLLLDDNMLAGEIPTWLFKIRTLNVLYIGWKGSNLIWNNTTKVDPKCSLQVMSMPSCGISGQIPEWISSQKELGELDLSGNKLEGRFPHWLAEMNNIDSIFLSGNNLSGQIPPRLFISSSLAVLDLSRNNFSGELPENIGNATKISYLLVSENNFSGLIPKSISNLKRLSVLDLSRNKFSGDNLPVLNKFSGSLPFKDDFYLDLSNNDLSGKIPTNFPKGTEILYLGGNKFSGSLPLNLTKLVNLRVLDLHNSIITGNLQDILFKFPTSLEILILRNTSLNGFIPNNISMCSSLRILDLSRNNLTGSIPRQMANLPIMNMSTSPKPIYSSTGDLVEDWLQDLIVNWKKSSQRLGNPRLFVLLDLSSNNISGKIPTSLGNLKALKQLNISHNKISGNIPVSLGNLVGIESLDVSDNELSGSIPQSLNQLGNLTVLDVSDNMLTGKIPRGGQMDTMNELRYFQNNSGLCGMQIKIECPEDIPSSEGRVEEEEDLSWIFWEGTWIGFPIGFFSTILIMSYLLNFIHFSKFGKNSY